MVDGGGTRDHVVVACALVVAVVTIDPLDAVHGVLLTTDAE